MTIELLEKDLGAQIARDVRRIRRLVISGGFELVLTCVLAIGMGLGAPKSKPFWIPASILMVAAVASLFGANACAARTTRTLERVDGIDAEALRRHGLPPRRVDKYRRWRELVRLDPPAGGIHDSPVRPRTE